MAMKPQWVWGNACLPFCDVKNKALREELSHVPGERTAWENMGGGSGEFISCPAFLRARVRSCNHMLFVCNVSFPTKCRDGKNGVLFPTVFPLYHSVLGGTQIFINLTKAFLFLRRFQTSKRKGSVWLKSRMNCFGKRPSEA